MFEAKRLAPTSVQCIDRDARKYPPTLLLFDRHEAWEDEDDGGDGDVEMIMGMTMMMTKILDKLYEVNTHPKSNK